MVLKERVVPQDYRSTYNDIRDWLSREREGDRKEDSKIDWDDVVFEIDLLKSGNKFRLYFGIDF